MSSTSNLLSLRNILLFCVSIFCVLLPVKARTFDLKTDGGAVGDGVTDDAPALQRIFNRLNSSGSERDNVILVPAGHYLLKTPVRIVARNSLATLTIQGAPSLTRIDVRGNGTGLNLDSDFIISTGEASDALTPVGFSRLKILDLSFSGTPDALNDAHAVLAMSEIGEATIRHCEFYGLSSLVEDGAIVYAYHCHLFLESTAFLGCSTTSGLRTSVVQNIWWKGITVTDTKFVDYGERPFYGKTGLASPYSWISIGNAAQPTHPVEPRNVFIDNVFLDEGGFIGISCVPEFFTALAGSAPIDLVSISRLKMNVTNLGASGLYLSQAKKVTISDSSFGWSHNADTAIDLHGIGEAIVAFVECVASANTIRADEKTRQLTVIDSVYTKLDSAAPLTNVINSSVVALPLRLNDAALLTQIPAGGMARAVVFLPNANLNQTSGTAEQDEERTSVSDVEVSVDGIAAEVAAVSPSFLGSDSYYVDFAMPDEISANDHVKVIVQHQPSQNVATLDARIVPNSPLLISTRSAFAGQALAQDADTFVRYNSEQPVEADAQTRVMLYVTGCRSLIKSHGLILRATTEAGASVNIPIEYAVPQGALPGLDVLIVTLPTDLAGGGRVQLTLNNTNDLSLRSE